MVLLAILCLLPAPRGDGASKQKTVIVPLSITDPRPHFAEAWRDRYLPEPRYDIPPRGFNEHSFFDDALVNFDAARGWTAYMRDCEGIFCLSKDQPIRHKPNVKIEVRLTGKHPSISLRPPRPIPVARAFDTLEIWFYGHKVGPKVGVVFRKVDGTRFRWRGGGAMTTPPGFTTFWNRLRFRFRETLQAGATLEAVEIFPRRWKGKKYQPGVPDHKKTLLYYVDQLRVSFFADKMKQPAPRFTHRDGAPTIPTDPRGACPRTVEPVATQVSLRHAASRLAFATKRGEQVTYVYTPKTGSLSDLTVLIEGKHPFRPAVDSGPVFDFNGKLCGVVGKGGARATLLSHRLEGDAVVADWRYAGNGASQTVRYKFSLKGKTLQIELASTETHFAEWKFGYAERLRNYKVVDVPFMTVWSPKLLVNDGWFVTYCADWYKNNVSTIPNAKLLRTLPEGCAQYSFGDREYDEKYNKYTGLAGGYSYLPRTDGSRHPLKECFYITVSSNVDDVWLNIANPPSPMKRVLKKRLYHMVAVWEDYIHRCEAIVDMYNKYGMTNIYWLFHQRLWTKQHFGCDPFFGADTVSIVHEPTGGDAALIRLLRKMRGMGIRTGYYDGYESMKTTHKWFQPDWCKYQPDGNWHARHGPVMKPWALSEYAATVYRKRARKFGAQVSYQDGWTSSNCSAWNDYDHRYPESGKFIDTLRALAAGWQRCRENVDGPVFSEGRGGDYYTAGLNDGDYSKLAGDTNEKPANEDRNYLLVNFRLKKISPLCPSVSLNIGYVRWAKPWSVTMYDWKDFSLYHHFLAAQIAFGTIGMLEPYYELPKDPHRYFDVALRGYYLLQQLQERYIMEPVEEIRYFDGERLVTSSEAIVRGVYEENRLRIRYANGLTIHINMNWGGKHWRVEDRGQAYDLPPGGWLATQGDDFLEYSAIENGKRIDFVDSPAYVYLDGFGTPVAVNGYRATHQFIKFKTGPRAGMELRYPER